jgi:hypothetical protein
MLFQIGSKIDFSKSTIKWSILMYFGTGNSMVTVSARSDKKQVSYSQKTKMPRNGQK